MKKYLKISNYQDYNLLIQSPTTYSYVEFSLSNLTPEENTKISKMVNEKLDYCGCGTGKYFVLFSIFLLTVFNYCNVSLFKMVDNSIIDFSLKVILFGIVGKLFALTINHFKLKQILKKNYAQHGIGKMGAEVLN